MFVFMRAFSVSLSTAKICLKTAHYMMSITAFQYLLSKLIFFFRLTSSHDGQAFQLAKFLRKKLNY